MYTFTYDSVNVLILKEMDVSLTYTYLDYQYDVFIPTGFDTKKHIENLNYIKNCDTLISSTIK